MNLFIIDDDPFQHFIMEKMLTPHLTNPVDQVTHSDNADEILKFIEVNRSNADRLPDIIFLDLNMPIMNGWDFLERYKRIQQKITKLIPIYIISSSIDSRDISRLKKYTSVKDYVLKPVTRPALEKIFDTGAANAIQADLNDQ
ncbi:Response regulator receiver domain-containing protein [Mucilaginibacter mallensis]|uniref:Response regulator receiver domain-containing protein n=1 Tax=Mucilaginibacter mallensis TaxID=652787 RepID=A0A1H1XCN8_MUCMA|nr:response regulator [Mucilaginibacter mallensis]SDT06389.1 Response regulator receiver domain-containing protein [Mucilaginibacter mallensis]